MENIELSKSLIEITSDREVFKFIHKNSYEIVSLSDFLKLPKKDTENNLDILFDLIKILDDRSIKMDYELTFEELEERNKARIKISKSISEKRASVDLDALLKKEIIKLPGLRSSSKVKKILAENGIITLSDILVLDYHTLCGNENGCLKLPYQFVKELSSYLKSNGLELMMMNPFTLDIKDRDEFKKEKTISKTVKIDEKEDTEKKQKATEEIDDEWYRKYDFVKLFYYYHHHIFIPKGYMCDGTDLGEWLEVQKKSYFSGKLKLDEIKALGDLDIIWWSERTNEGIKKKKKILKNNNIKFIKFINEDVITVYSIGKEMTTRDIDYRADLSKLMDGEKIDEIIEQRESMRKINSDNETLSEANNYIQRFKELKDEEAELKDDIQKLESQLEEIKSDLFIAYETKYNKMCELFQVGIQIDVILEREKGETDVSRNISKYGLLSPEESRKLTVDELIQKTKLMDKIIEGMNEFIKISLIELKKKEFEKEREICNLRQIKENLNKELGLYHNTQVRKK